MKTGIEMLPRKVHLPKIKNPPPKIDPLVAKRRKILELQGRGLSKSWILADVLKSAIFPPYFGPGFSSGRIIPTEDEKDKIDLIVDDLLNLYNSNRLVLHEIP